MSSDGGLPSGWALATLPEMVGPNGLVTDGDWVESKDQDDTGDAKLIQLGDLGDGYFARRSIRRMLSNRAREMGCTFLREGDLLIARMPDPLGRACVFPADTGPCVTVVDVCVVRFGHDELSPRWLMHFLNAPQSRAAIAAQQSGTTRKRISKGNLTAIPLPVPPRLEQERIASSLDAALSSLDEATGELQAAMRKLHLYRQSMLKSAVEGTLTAEWRRQSHPVESGAELLERMLSERARAVSREAMGPDLTGAPPLPEGWVWASLDQLLCSLRSGTAETSGRAATPFPVLKSSAVRHGSIDYTLLNYLDSSQSRAENFLATGDLLITRLSGSVEYVGCAAMVESEQSPRVQYPDRVFCVRPVSGAVVLTPFVVLCFEAGLIRERIEAAAKSTAGHKRISMSDLRPLPIPIPPLDEVVRIVEVCGAELESAQELARGVDRQMALITAQRQNILRSAFSGQLVPQDPSDEPASVLLDRIRTQRQAAAPTAKRKAGRPAKVAA